ncbi:MAG: PDDEXK nuclease domain-containing protein [Bacteroidales bacterium]|nr:PDDEXK nuclease domain-containing protein [Bacteroidales bacterium]
MEGNWGTRQLREDRCYGLFFERILMSSKNGRTLVKKEADEKWKSSTGHILKDPYVLKFLNLNHNTSYYEKEIEQALIDKLQTFLLELAKAFLP